MLDLQCVLRLSLAALVGHSFIPLCLLLSRLCVVYWSERKVWRSASVDRLRYVMYTTLCNPNPALRFDVALGSHASVCPCLCPIYHIPPKGDPREIRSWNHWKGGSDHKIRSFKQLFLGSTCLGTLSPLGDGESMVSLFRKNFYITWLCLFHSSAQKLSPDVFPLGCWFPCSKILPTGFSRCRCLWSWHGFKLHQQRRYNFRAHSIWHIVRSMKKQKQERTWPCFSCTASWACCTAVCRSFWSFECPSHDVEALKRPSA